MDSKRIDRLATTVSQFASRRSLFRGLVAGAASSFFGLLGASMLPPLADVTVAKKKKCKGNQKKCGNKCIPKSGCCKTGDCKKPSNPCERVQCQGNKCKKSLQPNGTACGEGLICIDGECLAECEPGASCDGDEICCSSICVDTDTSFENCGGCGDACDADTADTCAGGECQCGNSDPCEGDLVCTSGACECPTGKKFCDGECIPNADVCFARVTPSNLQGWLLEGEDPFSQNSALTQIVDGPDDPPAPGEGSAQLHPTAFGTFTADQTQAVLRTLQYEGTKVEDITTLSYSVYVPSTDGDPPTMQLAVLGAPSSEPNGFASLVFIPGDNGNSAPNLDDWTNYTPTESGFWVSTRDILGPSEECLMCRFNGSTHFGDCQNSTTCAAVVTRTWDQIASMMPDAALNNSGSFSVRIGRGDTGEGNVTNVVFNDDGYFFEEE